MDRIQMACGISKLVEHGVREYVRQRKCKPFVRILHPVHAKGLADEQWDKPAMLDGVNFVVNPLFEMPVLIDENGQNFEL
ncbi:conserved hypothetical protein [Paraburkholderia tropica]|nr:conserved hypothetical protein [Paraburkholderia tropica]